MAVGASLAGLLVIVGLALPASAAAGLLESFGTGTFLNYRHIEGLDGQQAHDVVVERLGELYRITDRGTDILICPGPPAPCQPPPCFQLANPKEAFCVAASVELLFVTLGESSDRLENQSSLPITACGGAGSDFLSGGSGRDTIGGGPGRDEVRGGAGSDSLAIDVARLIGGIPAACEPGAEPHRFELLDGGAGNDVIEGGPGGDLLRGGEDDDRLFAYGGDDRLDGGDGGDMLLGLEGADLVAGGAERDYLFGGPGSDELEGGPGDDDLGRAVRYDADGGGPGSAAATAFEDGDDRLDGGDGSDSLHAGPGAILFDLTDLEATLAAVRRGVVDRTFESPTLNGADRLIGGPGDDLVMYLNRAVPVEVWPDGVANDGSAGEGDSLDADVERITGGAGDDLLRAAPGGSLLFGDLGEDLLMGGAGPDTLIGGDGPEADRLAGAGGADELAGGPGNDSLDGAAGLDVLLGGGDDDQLIGGRGTDGLEGGSGSDRLHGGPDADCLEGSVIPAQPAAGEPAGCPRPSTLTRAVGADGDDLLDGGSGADHLAGGEGEDLADYSSRRADVRVILPGAAAPWLGAFGSSLAEDVLAPDVEGARGGRGHDLLVGNSRDNILDGGPGDDQVEGGSGVDRLRGGSGRDFVMARDAEPDAVRCGTKRDLAVIDGEDEVVAALSDVCERVDGGGSRPARRAARVGPASSCLLPFRPPGARRVFLLSMRAALPWATRVDASSCRARLRGASGTPAGRRAAELSRGVFSIRPVRARALIRLGLRGGAPAGCHARGVRVRRLEIRGAPPGLVVSGRRLSARGAGASWVTIDGCMATAVRVRTGRVRVFDETRRRRLVIRSGGRHVAPWSPQAGTGR